MELTEQLAAVGIVLGLLAGALWWLRRRGMVQVRGLERFALRRAPARRMERMERLALSPQHTLHLVRLDQTTLVVAASPSGCSLIQTIPAAAPTFEEVRRSIL